MQEKIIRKKKKKASILHNGGGGGDGGWGGSSLVRDPPQRLNLCVVSVSRPELCVRDSVPLAVTPQRRSQVAGCIARRRSVLCKASWESRSRRFLSSV